MSLYVDLLTQLAEIGLLAEFIATSITGLVNFLAWPEDNVDDAGSDDEDEYAKVLERVFKTYSREIPSRNHCLSKRKRYHNDLVTTSNSSTSHLTILLDC